jgi:hypothetical protein
MAGKEGGNRKITAALKRSRGYGRGLDGTSFKKVDKLGDSWLSRGKEIRVPGSRPMTR